MIPAQDERTLALLAHILQIVAGWLGPLIILLVRRDSRFVTFHALQVLFLQLVRLALMIAVGVCFFFGFVLSVAMSSSHVPSPLPSLFFPTFILAWFGPWVAVVVMGIVFGVRANQGEWAEYPVVGALARKILQMGPGGIDLRTTVAT
jgi:uncharacterized membrane protein